MIYGRSNLLQAEARQQSEVHATVTKDPAAASGATENEARRLRKEAKKAMQELEVQYGSDAKFSISRTFYAQASMLHGALCYHQNVLPFLEPKT